MIVIVQVLRRVPSLRLAPSRILLACMSRRVTYYYCTCHYCYLSLALNGTLVTIDYRKLCRCKACASIFDTSTSSAVSIIDFISDYHVYSGGSSQSARRLRFRHASAIHRERTTQPTASYCTSSVPSVICCSRSIQVLHRQEPVRASVEEVPAWCRQRVGGRVGLGA